MKIFNIITIIIFTIIGLMFLVYGFTEYYEYSNDGVIFHYRKAIDSFGISFGSVVIIFFRIQSLRKRKNN